MRLTFLAWIYLLFALAGLVFPWYYNLQFMLYSGKSFTVTELFAQGMSTPLGASLTVDLFIGATPALFFIAKEGKRLKMKNLWFYFVATFLVAFAFAFPFFLFMRERRLSAAES